MSESSSNQQDDRRQELLSYIKDQIQRELDENRRRRVAIWTLLAAIGWLILQLLHGARGAATSMSGNVGILAFTLPLLWKAWDSCVVLYKSRYCSSGNYRIRLSVDTKPVYMQCLALFGPLSFLSILFVFFKPVDSTLATITAWLNITIFGATIAAVIIAGTSLEWLAKFLGQTPIAEIPVTAAESSVTYSILRAAWGATCAANVVALLWLLLVDYRINLVPFDLYRMAIVAMIYIVMCALVYNIPNFMILNDLRNLERDAILYEKSVADIVADLELVVFGHEASSWLGRKRRQFQEFCENATDLRRKMVNIVKELHALRKLNLSDDNKRRLAALSAVMDSNRRELRKRDAGYVTIFEAIMKLTKIWKRTYPHDAFIQGSLSAFEAGVTKDFNRIRRFNRRLDVLISRGLQQ